MLKRSCIAITLALPLIGTAYAEDNSPGKVISPYAVIHTVPDLDKSTAFYRDKVGLEIDSAPLFAANATKELAALTNAKGARVRSTTFKIPGSELHLILLQFSGVEQKHVEARIQDPGVVKLVIRVRDIDKPFAAVQPDIKGVFSTGGAPVHPEGPKQRVQAVIVKDPDGFALEFVLANADIKSPAPATSNIVGGWASLVVENEDQSLKFYGEQLGFKINKGRLLAPSVLALEGTPDASVTNTGTRPPGSEFTWFVYDFRNIDRKALHSKMQDVGNSAVAMLATNLPELTKSLTANGATPETNGKALPLGENTRAVAVRDPSGIPFILVEQTH
jgi:catechol 2,3-dioxygenase-like lactoylglutathione lyase family enzyme